jgi:hypothetical protein
VRRARLRRTRLALAGHGKDAVAEILEIARASKEGDASATNFLERRRRATTTSRASARTPAWTWHPDKTTELVATTITADLPPAIAAGKNGTIAYTFEAACGTLFGTLAWNGKTVDVKEKRCEDL